MGEWEAKHLGAVCEMQAGKFIAASEISERQVEGLYPCFGGNGLRGYTKAFNQSGRYSLIGRQGALCGNVNLAEGNFYATEHAIVTTPKPGNTTDWLFYNLCLLNLNQYATGQAQPGLSIETLAKVGCATPKDEREQQKIADCLASLDERITLEAQQLDTLKTHKKGLMQQLFPAEGETLPQQRFPEFRDAGEWEARDIGEVFRVTRGEVLSMNLVTDERTDETPYPVFSSQTKSNGLAGFYSEYLYEDAITWTTDGANAGDVNYRQGKFYCTNVCGVLINQDGYANSCIAALINGVAKKYVSYVGNPKLMNGVMSRIVIPFPSLKEQQKIASCLASLDHLITTQTQKLAALKTHKLGLMQQLFPTLENIP